LRLNIFPENSKCLAKKHLTESIFRDLNDLSTASGFTFAPLLQPIIMEYHRVDESIRQTSIFHPVQLDQLDPEGEFILSSRIRVARNIDGFSFTPQIDSQNRGDLEEKICNNLATLREDLQGQYFSFEKLTKSQDIFLNKNNLLFGKGDRFQDAAGINRDFPVNRGIFVSSDKRLRIWVNEEDHLRIICQDNSSDFAEVFNHLCQIHGILANSLVFSQSKKYGFLTSCPTNIGTSMRAGVHIRLKKLSKNRKILDDIARRYDLQIRGTRGEKTRVEDYIFDISNSRRFGFTEIDIIHSLHNGISAIIDAEKTV